MLISILSFCTNGGKDTLTLKKKYRAKSIILTQNKNPIFLKSKRGILDQKLYLKTYKKYGYESSKNRKNFGSFQSVKGDSIYLKSLGGDSELMSFAIKDLEFIQIYNGKGTRFVGGVILGGNLLLAFGGLTSLNANPDIGAVLILMGAAGAVTGHLIKGKRYKMSTWEVVVS
tara:strand:- start:147 stop:662 length:516 start_codon:yes stop_codon:yes gene_type:complete